MQRLRIPLIGLTLVGLAAACSLIDPLSGISDGETASKTKSSSSSGASNSSSSSGTSSGATGDDDDDGAVDASSSSSSSSSGAVFDCTGNDEVEPNESTGTPLIVGFSCGQITSASDIDRWSFQNATTSDLKVTVKVAAAQPISQMIQAGSSVITGTSGQNAILQLKAGASLLLQLTPKGATTEPVPYKITFAAD